MKKNNLLIILIMIFLVIGGLSIYYFGFKDKIKEENEITESEKKFKEEYESLNGKVNKNGIAYKNISIKEDNNIVYITDSEAVNIIKKETAVIYMGFNTCPWCRNLVPILLDSANNMEIEKIYYLDILNIRSIIELDAKNNPQVSRKGSDAYYELVDLLKDYLEDYMLITSNGKKVFSGEKRIMAPTTIAVKDGIVVGFLEGTVDDHVKIDDVLPDLTNEQTKELKLRLDDMLNKLSGSSCTNNGC